MTTAGSGFYLIKELSLRLQKTPSIIGIIGSDSKFWKIWEG
eukprot:CAMPEP_0185724254 /NCGR_PEP_ID=MMETSP1171-20130828/791_1 /TAXON_ID=374046 /ORGANISM="Helicotheca tamensis, Strain CCMP826" /LENGTH=40 /DNA_ID= /DNA_START= /DNA_END= /DNA_ORIENTATION=